MTEQNSQVESTYLTTNDNFFDKSKQIKQLSIYLCIVKSSNRILSVVFLIAIYCFAISVITKSFAHSDFQNKQTSSQEKIISDFSTKLFCQTSQSESSVNNFNNLPTPNFKNSFTVVKVTEQLFETEFSQYTFFSRNILTSYRKSDLIFPFHYFW